MYGHTFDLGDGSYALRAFGPPEVDELAGFAGNATNVANVSSFWEEILAVSLLLTADGTVVTRTPRLSYRAGEATPFAQVIAAFGRAAAAASRFTFAVDVTATGALSAASIVTPIPRLLLLPGWSVLLDVLAGVAGDAATEIRVTRQRWQPIRLEKYGRE